jgi:adenosylcobinamide kinase / adenosylcobinamide-phosphate guanylyltransferase
VKRVLVLGGARSGKSAFAERLAASFGEPVLYVATATVTDAEMAERISRHRAQRPPGWRTLEEPLRVAQRVEADPTPATTVLVEDLTLLLSNFMVGESTEGEAEGAAHAELAGLLALRANLVLVSNEVGMGIVPPYPLGRVFRDALGRLNQAAASACDEVYLLVAGLPLRLK